jgi:penicillin-binding protein 2
LSDNSFRRDNGSRFRVFVLAGLILVTFSVYLIHLFSMQIVDGYIYRVRAEETRKRTVVLPAERGEIFDRNYDIPLATNRSSFAITITPADLPIERRNAVITRLADVLEIAPSTIESKLPEDRLSSFDPVDIQTGVSFERVTYIAEHSSLFPGVSWHSRPVRQYTMNDTAAHVLGYVGEITPEELQVLFNQGYDSNSVVGKSGVERQYDHLLRGEDGMRVRTVDAQGRSVGQSDQDIVPPVPGQNLVLTIDRRVQELAQKALGERIGAAVVLKPHTGEVLAMVSYPRFNPNLFYGTDGANRYSTVSSAEHSPFVNRAIQSAYPPASTFKILMTTAVIEEGVFGLQETINTKGYYRLGNRVFKDWRENGFGRINIFGALANSSNEFFYNMGHDYLGVERIIEYSQLFGLGQKTNIDLPSEVAGLIPTPEWKRRTQGEPWVGGDTVNMSIGQGYVSATPLQMANAVAMIVNEGVVYRPHVLKEVRSPVTGELTRQVEREVLLNAPIQTSTFTNVKRAMRGVITDGTAKVVITTDAVEAAGKTGTGEVGREDQWHSWFVAYAPYDAEDPDEQIVVAVLVEAANEWEWWAPKAANIILEGYFSGSNYEQAIQNLRPLWYL